MLQLMISCIIDVLGSPHRSPMEQPITIELCAPCTALTITKLSIWAWLPILQCTISTDILLLILPAY